MDRTARLLALAAIATAFFTLHACGGGDETTGDDDDLDGVGDDDVAPGCLSDADCTAPQLCTPAGQCAAVECTKDEHCKDAAKSHCELLQFKCVAPIAETCGSDADCDAANKEYCNAEGACVAGQCLSDADCAEGVTCDKAAHTCGDGGGGCNPAAQQCSCAGDADCAGAAGFKCDAGFCKKEGGCTSSADCSGGTPVCNTVTGVCEATPGEPCGGTECAVGQHCLEPEQQCVQCRDDTDCNAGFKCDPAAHTCAQDTTPPCEGPCCPNVCVEGKEYCDETSKTCGELFAPEDCGGVKCNFPAMCAELEGGTLECQISPSCDPPCGEGEKCAFDFKNHNRPYCAEDNQAGVCGSLQHVAPIADMCTSCTTDAECAPGLICWSLGDGFLSGPGPCGGTSIFPGGIGGEQVCYCTKACKCDEECPTGPPTGDDDDDTIGDDDDTTSAQKCNTTTCTSDDDCSGTLLFPACSVSKGVCCDVADDAVVDDDDTACDCGGKQCGDDGCGGSCGDCDPGFACTAQGFCLEAPSTLTGQSCGQTPCGGADTGDGDCAGDAHFPACDTAKSLCCDVATSDGGPSQTCSTAACADSAECTDGAFPICDAVKSLCCDTLHMAPATETSQIAPPCTTDADCAAGEVCDLRGGSVCVPAGQTGGTPCTMNGQCQPNEHCDTATNTCAPGAPSGGGGTAPPVGGQCSDNSACVAPATCEGGLPPILPGTCQIACASETDTTTCPGGMVCCAAAGGGPFGGGGGFQCQTSCGGGTTPGGGTGAVDGTCQSDPTSGAGACSCGFEAGGGGGLPLP